MPVATTTNVAFDRLMSDFKGPTMTTDTVRDEAATTEGTRPQDDPATGSTADIVRLESCAELEWIVVTTHATVYDLIVLDGPEGHVMVRGGRFFRHFQPAIVTGSTFGGTAVQRRTIGVGLFLEFNVDGKPIVTSRVEALSRHRLGYPAGRC